MAKKKKGLDLKLILAGVSALLALVAFFLMFAPAATALKGNVSYTGAQMTFGYTEGSTIKVEIFKFSFLNLLPYILLVAGIVFNALTKICRFSNIISAACYLVAGVLFFLVVVMCSPLVESVKDGLSLGAGAIVAGVLSIIAALASAATLVLKK